MMIRLFCRMLFFLVALLSASFLTQSALADETTEAILDILHERGDISDETYEELKQKEKEEVVGTKIYWKNNLRIESEFYKVQVGGRLLVDFAVIDADDQLEAAARDADAAFEGNGTEIRQARIYLSGSFYDRVAFQNEFEFAGGDVDFTENWIALTDLGYLGTMRIGHTKEPFSLERLNSRLYMTFMERALPDGIVPGRNTGIRFHNASTDLGMSWAFGVFKEVGSDGSGFTNNSDYNVTGRLTWAPWYAEDGSRLLHLGLGYSHKFTSEDTEDTWPRFRKRPELHISSFRPIDTGTIAADGVDLVGPEAALVLGPFSVQGEYWYASLDSDALDDPRFDGYYVLASWFLTGEHRNYKITGGDGAEFGMVDILSPFDASAGTWGAWELAARYSDVDLNDDGIEGGEMNNITLGLNWYPYRNLRWTVNYVRINVEDSGTLIADADADAYQTRFTIYF